jgi:hypothetical protein
MIKRTVLVADLFNNAADHPFRALIEKCSGIFNGPREFQIECQRDCTKVMPAIQTISTPTMGIHNFVTTFFFVSILLRNDVRKGRI